MSRARTLREQVALGGMDSDALQRAARQAARYHDGDAMSDINRAIRAQQKRAEQEAKAAERAAKAADREAAAAAKRQAAETARQNRAAEKEMKGSALGFFTDEAGNVRPITAPSGGVMRQFDKSGTMFDSETGKAYTFDRLSKTLKEIIPEQDGQTVTKDGHVYKVVPGMGWKWMGYDGQNIQADKGLTRSLAEKGKSVRDAVSTSKAEETALGRDIASDQAQVRELEQKKRMATEEERKALDERIGSLNAGIQAKRERQAQAELNTQRAIAEQQQFNADRDKSIAENIAAKQAQAYDPDRLTNTGRQPELYQVGLGGALQQIKPYNPVALDIQELIGDIMVPALDSSGKVLKDSKVGFASPEAAALGSKYSVQNQKSAQKAFFDAVGTNVFQAGEAMVEASFLPANLNAQAAGQLDQKFWSDRDALSAKLHEKQGGDISIAGVLKSTKLDPDARKRIETFAAVTGKTHIPQSWTTMEAGERQLAAKEAGQDKINLPEGFRMEGGKVFAPTEESQRIFGISIPGWNKKGETQVGELKFDDAGMPFLVLNPDTKYSTSFQTGDYYRGIPEYTAMPKEWAESFKASQMPKLGDHIDPVVRKEAEAAFTPEKLDLMAQQAWDSRRWSAQQTADFLTDWQSGNDRERAEIIASIDPRQANLPWDERRLDGRYLVENGFVSAQDGRLLMNAAYGTDPATASVNDAWRQYVASSDSKEAKALRQWESKYQGVKGIFERALDVMPITGLERARIGVAYEDAAKQQFLTEYFQSNRNKPDFDQNAFYEQVQKFHEWQSPGDAITRMAGGLSETILNAAGSTIAAAKQFVNFETQSLFEYFGAEGPLWDDEIEMAGASTSTAVQNMHRAALDRGRTTSWDEFWSGKQGSAISKAADELFEKIGRGQAISQEQLKEYASRLQTAAEAFDALGTEGAINQRARMSWENDILDPRNQAAKYILAYQDTLDPAYLERFKQAMFMSERELAMQDRITDYGSNYGAISETAYFSPAARAIQMGNVMPFTETGMELLSTVLSAGVGKALTVGKAVSTAAKAGSTLHNVSRAVSKLDDLAAKFSDFGRIAARPGVQLGRGAQAWNSGLNLAKTSATGAFSEFFEEAVAAFGDAGATFGDSIEQGFSGLIGGFGQGAMMYPVGAAVAQSRVRAMQKANDKALQGFVDDWNRRDSSNPITLAQLKQTQSYTPKPTVETIRGNLNKGIVQAQQGKAALVQLFQSLKVSPVEQAGRRAVWSAPQTETGSVDYSAAIPLSNLKPGQRVFVASAQNMSVVSDINGVPTILLDNGKVAAPQSPSDLFANPNPAADKSVTAPRPEGVPVYLGPSIGWVTVSQEQAQAVTEQAQAHLQAVQQGEAQVYVASLDMKGATMQALRAVEEINGLDPNMGALVDALVAARSGFPLTPKQEKIIAGSKREDGSPAAYYATNGWIVPDDVIADIQTLAPTTAEYFFTLNEAEQLQIDVAQAEDSMQGGQTVSRVAHAHEIAGSIPVPATTPIETPQDVAKIPSPKHPTQETQAAAPVAGGTYQWQMSYLPRGASDAVLSQHSATSLEEAEKQRDSLTKALGRIGTDVQAGEIIFVPANPQDAGTATGQQEASLPQNQAVVLQAPDTNKWMPEAVRKTLELVGGTFGYKIVDTGIAAGVTDRYGNALNLGTAMYDKLHAGSELGQWIDKIGNSPFAEELAQKVINPGLHRVWFGHDFATNLGPVVDKFGWDSIPEYIAQLLKDSLTKSGIPLPGVELLVRGGQVTDRVATDWLSVNIGEVFGGGISFLGTYMLYRKAAKGNLTKPAVVMATIGIGLKLVGGVMTAQPFLILSGLADAAILVTNLGQVKEAFTKGKQLAGKGRPSKLAEQEAAGELQYTPPPATPEEIKPSVMPSPIDEVKVVPRTQGSVDNNQAKTYPKKDEQQIPSQDRNDETGRQGNLLATDDIAGRARSASQALEGVQRRLHPQEAGLLAAQKEYRIFGAEIAAVAGGTKPLFHENAFISAQAAMEAGQELADMFPALLVGYRGTSIYVANPALVQDIMATDPAHYGTDMVEAIETAIDTDAIGELLGYGARTREAGNVVIEITDQQGKYVTGFVTTEQAAQGVVAARLSEYVEGLGEALYTQQRPRIEAKLPDTPENRRIAEARSLIPDGSLLAVRQGDRYFFYGSDAVNAATIFKTSIKEENGVPTSSIPTKRSAAQLNKLVRAGLNIWTLDETGAPQRHIKQGRFSLPYAPLGQPDIIDQIVESGGIRSKDPKKPTPEYDDMPENIRGVYRRILGGRFSPDQIAQGLQMRGIGDGSVEWLWSEVERAIATRRNLANYEQHMERIAAEQMERFENFESEVVSPQAKDKAKLIPVQVSDLQTGQVLEIDGHKLRVTAIDPETFDVTLEDGKHYGIQEVKDGSVIYVEVVPKELAPTAATPEGKKTEKQPLTPEVTPADTTQTAPAGLYDGPVNAPKLFQMLQDAVPWLTYGGQQFFKIAPRVYTNGSRLATKQDLEAMPADEKAAYRQIQNSMAAQGPMVFIDQANLTKELNSTAPENRKAYIEALVRHEMRHLAQFSIENSTERFAALWRNLPEEIRTKVEVAYNQGQKFQNDTLGGLEFERMVHEAHRDGATTEQVDMLNDAYALSQSDKNFAKTWYDIVKDIAEFLRTKLMGAVTGKTRQDLLGIIAETDAQLARIEAIISGQKVGQKVGQNEQQQETKGAEQNATKPDKPPKKAKKKESGQFNQTGDAELDNLLADFEQFLPPAAARRRSITDDSMADLFGAPSQDTAARRNLEGGVLPTIEQTGEGQLFGEADMPFNLVGEIDHTPELLAIAKAKQAALEALEAKERAQQDLFAGAAVRPATIERPTIPQTSLDEAWRWAMDHIRGNYPSADLGAEVGVVRETLDHTRNQIGSVEKFAVVEVLPQIIANGKALVRNAPYSGTRQGPQATHILYAPVQFGDKNYIARLVVHQMRADQKPNQRAYDLKSVEVQEKTEGALSAAGQEPIGDPQSFGTITIRALAQAVNKLWPADAKLIEKQGDFFAGAAPRAQGIKPTPEFVATASQLADALWTRGYNTPEAFARFMAERFGDRINGKVLAQVWNLASQSDPDQAINWTQTLADIQVPQLAPDREGWTFKGNDSKTKRVIYEKDGVLAWYDGGTDTMFPLDISQPQQQGDLFGQQQEQTPTSPLPNRDSVLPVAAKGSYDRMLQAAEEYRKGGRIPYITAKRIMDEGRIQYEAYSMDGVQLATATAISGPGSISNKFERRKDIYSPATTATFTLGKNDIFSFDWLREEMDLNDAEIATLKAERETQEPKRGWQTFGPESLGIPRKDMPQVSSSARGALVNWLESKGVKVTNQTVRQDTLKPTQAEYNTEKVEAAAQRMSGTQRRLLVSQEGYLLDGHHQWMANNPTAQVDIARVDLPVREALALLSDFPSTQGGQQAAAQAEIGQAEIENADQSPQRRAANAILEKLRANEAFDWRELFAMTDKAWDGTQAQGTYTVKDAYDAMELAVNLRLQEAGISSQVDDVQGSVTSRQLAEMLQLLPTQTKRTEEADRMQQFSTPPHLAFAAAWVANIRQGDVMLEPSAGIGGLAVFAKNAGATVIANELSARRREFLAGMGFEHLTDLNAELLYPLMLPQIQQGNLPQPTVVVMNPPFSNAAASKKRGDTRIGAKHVEEALRLLPEGGRLVAIVGEGMALDAPTFRQWWEKIGQQYNVRANIWIDGKNYAKYGTTFSNRLLVIDKTGPTPNMADILAESVDEIPQLFTLLEGIRNDRTTPTTTQSRPETPAQPGSLPTSESGRGSGIGLDAANSPTGVSGGVARQTGNQLRQPASPDARQSGSPTDATADNGVAGSNDSRARGDAGQRQDGTAAQRPGSRRDDPATPATSSDTSRPAVSTEVSLQAQSSDERGKVENEDDVFAHYRPSQVKIDGAKPHLAPLVESAAMASVDLPTPTYTPNLPKEVITEGKLSEVQLESVVYAGQAHQQILADGSRRGFLLGDGTGVGKGRQIAGIILDNQRQGRKKAVWITEKEKLLADAKRDAGDMGLDPQSIVAQPHIKAKADIAADEGILFSLYSTLIQKHDPITDIDAWWERVNSGQENSRLAQLAKWMGRDFDGVIALDEAHNAKGAIAMQGSRGMTKPSKTGVAIIDLQKLFPQARVVYVSATGATEVENLSYADRLGIWGEGTPFAQKQDFFNQIRAGGISALEIVARDLKAQGLFLARSISYKGVEFSRLTQELTPEQQAIYDKIAAAWQSVLENVDTAMGESGMNNNGNARGKALSAFWGSQQRFFNQLLTALQMPILLANMAQQLEAEKSVVLQLVNTNESTEKRKLAQAMAESEGADVDLEAMDKSPRQILLEYLENSFPTTLYQEVQDPNNPDRTIWEIVRDAEGNPVQDPAAVARKNQLIDELSLIDMPQNPLDQIFEKFGEENVAEITGRTQRIVKVRDPKTGKVESKIQRRSLANREVEAQEFMDGDRRILIFSNAGGTGASYHASNKAKNQQRRVHYLVQAGWQADKALQGFGRTHRTDQASAPIYKLVETNIAGHKRFISTIARRLAQLGALTTGERKGKGTGIFSEADNVESSYASDALVRLIHDLHNDRIEGMTLDSFAKGLGFMKTQNGERFNTLVDPETGALVEDKLPAIPQFLNRILALPLEEQNRVFALFSERMEARIARAMNDGTYDPGTQNYHADELHVLQDEEVYRQEGTGAVTRIVEIEERNAVQFTHFKEIGSLGAEGIIQYVRNRKSGRIYALKPGPKRTMEDGSIRETYRRIGTRTIDLVEQGEITTEAGTPDPQTGKIAGQGRFEALDTEQAAQVWEQEIADAEKQTAKKIHFLVGAMLPIWDRIQLERPKIYRINTADEQSMLGVLIPHGEVMGLRNRMGAKNEFIPEQVFAMILDEATPLKLANGWKIRRAYVSGENRIEISGMSYNEADMLTDKMGGFRERIQFQTRYFLPNAASLGKVLAQSPIVEINNEAVINAKVQESATAYATPRPAAMEQAEWTFDRAETDAQANTLFNDNLPLATWFANRYRNIQSLEFDDVLQEARVGLWKAANSFDPGRGVPFGGFAAMVIRNRLNGLYRTQKRQGDFESTTLDAPSTLDGQENGSALDSLAAAIPNVATPEDLAQVREAVESLPARPKAILEAFMAGKSWRDIGKDFAISHEMARKVALGANNTLRAKLAKAGIRSVDDVFPTKDEFNLERLPTRRQPIEDESNWQYDDTPTVEEQTPEVIQQEAIAFAAARPNTQETQQIFREDQPDLPNLPVDAQAVEAYLEGIGAPATPERTQTSERISRTLSQPAARAVGGYAQGALFPEPQADLGLEFSQAGQQAARAVPANLPAEQPAATDSQIDGRSAASQPSQDLIDGLRGDWEALAREINAKGRASSILADLIDGRIPHWDVTGTRIESPADVLAVMQPIRSPFFESLKVLVVDGNNNVVASQIVSVGSLNESLADPKAIFSVLARLRDKTGKTYNSIILSHNHPTGDPSPSDADRRLTQQLQWIVDATGWKLIDHIITNGDTYFSFREAGVVDSSKTAEQAPESGNNAQGVPADKGYNAKADWEVVKRSELALVDAPDHVAQAAKFLRAGNQEAMHIFYLNTRNKLVALTRVPKEIWQDGTALTRHILETSSREGAYAIALDTHLEPGTTAHRELLYKIQGFSQQANIRLLDMVTYAPNPYGNPYQSAKEMGLLEEPGTYGSQSPIAAAAPRRKASFTPEQTQAAVDREIGKMRGEVRMVNLGERDQSSSKFREVWQGGWVAYQNFFRGRLDAADAFAPGIKKALQDAQREEQLAALQVNAVVDGLRRELQKAFGDPNWFTQQRRRMKDATTWMLPTASRLEVQELDMHGDFIWKQFERRAGYTTQQEGKRAKKGQTIEREGESFTVGDFDMERQAFELTQTMTPAMQQAIYDTYRDNFPEAVGVLDRWIMPGMGNAFSLNEHGTMAVEFNRYALLDLYNTWPTDMVRDNMAFQDVPQVPGYTPDVAAQRGLVEILKTLVKASDMPPQMRNYRSPGRKFKSGSLQASGNIKNLIDGFSTRAMEAHREKIRRKLREEIIQKAAKFRDEVPAALVEDGTYIPLDSVYDKLMESLAIIGQLDPKTFPHLTAALRKEKLHKIVGDVNKLAGADYVLHRNAYRELLLSVSRQKTEHILLKVADFFLRATKLGVLTAGSVGINWIGNELLRAVQTINRTYYGLTSLAVGDLRNAKLNGLEAFYLLRGMMTDRMPNTANMERIGSLIPRTLFDDQTALAALDAEVNYGNIVDDMKRNGVLKGPSQGLVNAFKQGGVSASILYAVNYSGGDASIKQAVAYAAYRARAEVAADEAGIKKGRGPWMRKWIASQIGKGGAIHQEVMDAARLWFMDYENVPSWMDPSATLPEKQAQRFLKAHGLWFVKWPYNMMRLMKRLGVNGLADTIGPSKTKAERAKGMANLATLASLAYAGAFLLKPEDDEDDPIIGSRRDAEGNLSDRNEDTSSRLNLSALARRTRLGRILGTALRMAGAPINEDFTNSRGDDLWMWYRNITWLPESLLMGRLVQGDIKGFLTDAEPYLADMAGLGILWRMTGQVAAGSADARKEAPNLLAEVGWEVLSSPINPSAITRYLGYSIDPVARRSKDSKTLGFDMTPASSIAAKIPGLTKTLPAAGDPVRVALAPFDEKAWFNKELRKLEKMKLDAPAERDAALQRIQNQAQDRSRMAVQSAQEMNDLLFGMGVDPAMMDRSASSSRNIVNDLARLRQLGVGPESVHVTTETLQNGQSRAYIAYPDPDTVAVRDPWWSMFKVATGVNIKPVPRKNTGNRPLTEAELFQRN